MINDWHHCNSLNYNQELGVIALNSKHWSTFVVIDHDGTFVPGDPAASKALAASPAGDLIYRFGNPSAYKQGDPPGFLEEGHQQMYGSHNIHWIPEGLPGGGNFLIFNNGCYNPRGFKSEILEITPYLDANGTDTGEYVNPPDAGYDANNNSKQIVWSYRSNRENSFYSNYISGCQRLPNGNTFINSGATGHFFEVTPTGEVAWEYINPVTSRGARKFILDADGTNTFNTFRATRYGPDHPALVGRDLTPMGKITEFVLGPFDDELNAFRNRK